MYVLDYDPSQKTGADPRAPPPRQKTIPYDEDQSSQLTTYRMDLQGSQFNFIKDSKIMDRKRTDSQPSSSIFQTQ